MSTRKEKSSSLDQNWTEAAASPAGAIWLTMLGHLRLLAVFDKVRRCAWCALCSGLVFLGARARFVAMTLSMKRVC